MIYRVFRLKDKNNNSVVTLLDLVKELEHSLAPEGLTPFGLFHGVFGLATNEAYWVLLANDASIDPLHKIEATGLSVVNQKILEPTVRPEVHEKRSKPGIYVFRWFKIRNKDVDEIARLSNAAWQTFEAGFDTEVQGLFAEVNRDPELGTMLLITWYKNLAVWQDSRAPDKAAKDFFMKRHELTIEATPIATRLI